jgi:hypothetical protein
MTQLAASSNQNPAFQQSRTPYFLGIDRLEQRLRQIFPLRLFLDYLRQFTAAVSVALIITVLCALLWWALAMATGADAATPMEIVAPLGYTAFATSVWAMILSLFVHAVRRFWRVGGLVALALTAFLAYDWFAVGARSVSAIVGVIETVVMRSPFVAAMLLGMVVLMALYYVHITWVLLRAGVALLLVNASQRAIERDLPAWQASGFFSRFWGFPPLYRFTRLSRFRHAAIVVLAVIAALFFCVATMVPFFLTVNFGDFARIQTQCRADAACMIERAWFYLAIFPFPFAGVFACVLVGSGAQRLLRRLLRFSLDALQEVDTRAPVLFLRAFKDDQIPLKPARLSAFGRVLELGRRPNSLDQLLLEEASPIGPVVGLGNPDDKRPPYGAARGYFDHKTWQEAVADLANNAILIVICIDDSAGIWWEVEHLVGRRHLHKTLFVLHPRYASASENAAILQRIAEWGSLAPGTPIGEGVSQSTIGFFQDKSGGTCVIRSSTFSRFAYLLTLRAFIRERFGLLPASLADRSRWPERL